MMRVTLIHPPQMISATNYVSGVAIPPLGLAYLASSLEAAGHSVQVVDAVAGDFDHVQTLGRQTLRGMDFDRIVEAVDPRSDIIGIGIMFSCSWPSLRDLVRKIKQRRPDKRLIVGGEHATAMTEEVINESPADLCVLGEGEETLVEICDRLDCGESIEDVPGTAHRVGDTVHRNPSRPRVRDLDSIPLPAWHHFDVEGYIAYGQPHGSNEGRSMPMLATRGCPYRCTFCSSPGMWGTRWYARDPGRVVDEMELYMARYGANDFHFEDLTAIVRKDWVLAFTKEILDRGLKISWQLPSGTRSEAIDEEAAGLMYRAGCRQFTYAIESGSVEMLKRIEKRIHLDKAFTSARGAMRTGIRVQGAFIYGFPGETWSQMMATWRTILKCAILGFHEINISAFAPLPNTALFRELQQQGRIRVDDDYLHSIFGYLDIWKYPSWNPRLPAWALRLVILFSYVSFFATSYLIRPQRAWRLVRGLFSSRSDGKLGKILKGMVKNSKAMTSGRTAPAAGN